MSVSAAGTQKTPEITHLRQFEGHTRGVLGVINVPGGQRIITCSADGSLRVWNLKTGLPIGKAWQDGESEVYAIALSPDRKKVVSGDRDVVVKLWNVDTGKVVAKWTGHTEEVRSVCWSRDGLRVLSGSSDGSARVWDAESGETILGPMETGMFLVAVSYSPDETLIAAGGYRYDGSSVNIFDAKTGKLVTTLGHEDMVNCLAWTADGNTLISGSTDRLIRVWNTTTWKNIAVWPEHHAKSVDGITISPNGRILATASSDRTAQLWNLDNGQLISSPLKHSDVVLCVSFSTDGKLLTTGCDDHSAYTWDVSAIVKEAGLGDLLSHSDALQADATRRPARPLNDARRLPQGFLDGTGDHSSSNRPPPRSSESTRQSSTSHPRRAYLDRFTSLFRRSRHPAIGEATAHGTPRIFHPHSWTRTIFSRRLHKRDHPDNELLEQHPPEVEVPYTRGLARNVRVKGKSGKKLPAPNNIMTINVAGTSQPSNGDAVQQQSSGTAQGQQLSPQSHVLLTTTPAASATTANMTSTGTPLHPDVVIRRPGYWTRFWLSLGCVSTENAANSL